MVLLVDAIEDKKMDIRMMERNLARGLMTPDDMDKAVKKLPDDAQNADWVNPENLVEEK